VGQILRVGKESKDQFDRKGNPLASIKALGHGSDGNPNPYGVRFPGKQNRPASFNVKRGRCIAGNSPEDHD
jgi:hypothetical protein